MLLYYADNLKLALKLRICVRFAAIFYVERVAVLTMTWSYARIAVIVHVKGIFLLQQIAIYTYYLNSLSAK